MSAGHHECPTGRSGHAVCDADLARELEKTVLTTIGYFPPFFADDCLLFLAEFVFYFFQMMGTFYLR